MRRRRVAQPDNSTTHHAHSRTAPRHQRRDLGVRALLASSARHGARACGGMGRGSIRSACRWQAPGRIRAAARGAECVLALLDRHARAPTSDPHAMTRRALIGPAAIVRVRRRCDRGGGRRRWRAVVCLPPQRACLMRTSAANREATTRTEHHTPRAPCSAAVARATGQTPRRRSCALPRLHARATADSEALPNRNSIGPRSALDVAEP